MSPHRLSTSSLHRSAFTLMEMVIAMGVLGLLMAGIFGVAKSTMELSSDLASSQERAMLRQNLIDYLRRSFRSLPGNAEIRLQNRSVSGTYIPSLTIVNGGNSFSPGDALPPETGLELTAEQRPGGYLRVLLRFLDDQQTLALRSGQNMRASKNDSPLTLMDQVSQFEWKFYDPNTQRWENTWKDPRRPLMAEMVVQLDDGKSMRAVFWIPPVVPVQNPVAPALNPAGGPGGAAPPPPGTVPPPPPANP
ncbi:MAG: type II secretion system protein [Verrucomicrobiaceae bacterium]|nr:type II secretion system protein [Verrucomicrobiaceae bacterium]